MPVVLKFSVGAAVVANFRPLYFKTPTVSFMAQKVLNFSGPSVFQR
jgi:hypothetical protein